MQWCEEWRDASCWSPGEGLCGGSESERLEKAPFGTGDQVIYLGRYIFAPVGTTKGGGWSSSSNYSHLVRDPLGWSTKTAVLVSPRSSLWKDSSHALYIARGWWTSKIESKSICWEACQAWKSQDVGHRKEMLQGSSSETIRLRTSTDRRCQSCLNR